MYKLADNHETTHIARSKIYTGRLLLIILPSFLISMVWLPVVSAAQTVSYSIKPNSGSYAAGSDVAVELSVTSTQAFAGVSADINPSNMTFTAFNTAGTSAFLFVDYHAEHKDVLAACQNNNCPAGTYKIGTFNFTAGQSGAMSLTVTPVETINTNLQQIGADGTSGSYSVNANLPPVTNTTPRKSTYTIPRSSASGAPVPTQIDDTQRTAYQENPSSIPVTPSTGTGDISGSTDHSGVSPGAKKRSNLTIFLIAGGVLVAGLTVAALIVRRRLSRMISGPSAMPGNNYGVPTEPYNPVSSTGPIVPPPDDKRPPQGPIVG